MSFLCQFCHALAHLMSVTLVSCANAFVFTLIGRSSCSKKSKGRGGDDRGAEESDEDAGYQICRDEKGCRGKGKCVVPIIIDDAVYLHNMYAVYY